MTREQLDLIPAHLLKPTRYGCVDLIDWLRARGWRMSLLDVDTERRRRGIPTRVGR